jgi:hypothetical protein
VAALVEKLTNLCHGQFGAAGGLGTGPVAVEAFQITFIGNVQLYVPGTSSKGFSHQTGDRTLGPEKLIHVQHNAFEGNVPMSRQGLHAKCRFQAVPEV